MSQQQADMKERCPSCGSPLGASAPRGLCVACLLRGAVENEPAPSPHALPRQLGDYELLELIARGGMGLVYKALHRPLDRIVALKLIAMGELAAPDFVERFRVEARAAASLDHPNIVPVYEVGEEDAQQFLSMRLIEGGSLADWMARREEPFPPAEAAALLGKVSRAVHYAHQRGILHRDIKPGNILMAGDGEPFLTDFGLAKVVESDSDITRTLAVLGTPAHMSPEQAAGATRELTVASDIYSLGSVLYELLVGSPPFTGGSSLEVLRKLVDEEPVPPGKARGNLGASSSTLLRSRFVDLELICLKCLSKEPERRYATANALADDLDRFVGGEPIEARRVTGLERAWLWCRRKPRQASLLALLVLAVSGGVAGVLTQWQRAEQHSRDLEIEKAATRLNLYASDMSAAMSAWNDGNLGLARRLLHSQRPEPGPNPVTDLRGFEWRFLAGQVRGDQTRIFRGHSNMVTCVAISPDLRSIVSGGMDQAIHWWDAESGVLHSNLNSGRQIVHSVGFAPDGHRVFAGLGQRLRAYDLRTGQRLLSLRFNGVRAALSPAKDHIVVGVGNNFWYGLGGDAYLSSVIDGITNTVELPGAGGRVALSADGTVAATGLAQGRIRFWSVPEGESLGQTDPVSSLSSLAVGRHGKWVAAAVEFSPHLRTWSVPDGRPLATLTGHELSIEAVAASPTDNLLATGGRDQKIVVWDMDDQSIIATLWGHDSEVRALSFSPDGRWLVSGSKDETVRLWELPRGRQDNVITNLSLRFGFGAPLYSPDGTLLAARTRGGGPLNLYDAESLTKIRTVCQHGRPLAFSPDSQQLVVLNVFEGLATWDLPSGRQLSETRIRFVSDRQAMSALSPSGTIVALGGAQGEVVLCDAKTGEETARLKGHFGVILSLAFSPRGDLLATTGQDNLIKLWNPVTGESLGTLRGHKWHLRVLAFSPDGRWLASGGHDNMIKIWNVRERSEVTTLKGHQSVVWDLAFTSDGRSLLSGGEDAVRFWNVATWREVGNLKTPVPAKHLILSPSTGSFAVGDAQNEGPLHFWRVPSLARLDAQGTSGR